jgi:predicted Ser/Thr protein kinase
MRPARVRPRQALMERRFLGETKSFLFTANLGKSLLRLEEKRKGFGGFLLLGIKLSDWLANKVEEAVKSQRKEDFARSFCDEARVLKI